MKQEKAINYLEKLEKGSFITINYPAVTGINIPVTAMYLGKDANGRFNFKEESTVVFTEDMLQRGVISIESNYDIGKALDIDEQVRKEYLKSHKQKAKNIKKNRDIR